jgi:hypothetical protein
VVHLYLVVLPSICRCCFTAPGSSCIFIECEFLQIIMNGLLFLGGLVAAYELVISAVELNSYALTDVNGCSIMIMVLMNLCAANIVSTTGFGDSSHSLSTYLFPSMQVVLVFMGLDVGSRAFSRLVVTKVLDSLGLSSLRITSLSTPGSVFNLKDCQSFLMLTLLGGTFAAYGLVTTDVAN